MARAATNSTAGTCTATSRPCCTTGMAGRSTSTSSRTTAATGISGPPHSARSPPLTGVSRASPSRTASATRSCGCWPRSTSCAPPGGADMAFEQLYYTSCERGVGGYAGFQFNALSQGAGAAIMRQVEQLTAYELPSWDTSPDDAPVNLCHVPDAARGGDITARVVYAGTDFSGRSGNYFAHALVTGNPQRDFGGLLPVELWESPVWSRTPADGTVLPTIPAAPPRGSFDRPAVAAFLAAQDDAQPVVARLVSAADQALAGGRALVLWSPTSADNAYWIAAISYLLGDARVREMSFYTYTRRPAQCRAHVIGTVPGAVTSPAA